MNKILSLGMGIIVASQVGSAPAAFAAVADLQKAADTAQAAAHASADKAYTLSGTTYENNSGASETSATAAGNVSQSKQTDQSLGSVSQKSTADRRVRVPQLSSKPSRSVGEGALAGGGLGFGAGFLTTLSVCMIPAAILSHVPIVGYPLAGIVAIPSAVIGVIAGVFVGAFGALFGAAAGGAVGGVID